MLFIKWPAIFLKENYKKRRLTTESNSRATYTIESILKAYADAGGSGAAVGVDPGGDVVGGPDGEPRTQSVCGPSAVVYEQVHVKESSKTSMNRTVPPSFAQIVEPSAVFEKTQYGYSNKMPPTASSRTVPRQNVGHSAGSPHAPGKKGIGSPASKTTSFPFSSARTHCGSISTLSSTTVQFRIGSADGSSSLNSHEHCLLTLPSGNVIVSPSAAQCKSFVSLTKPQYGQ
mmetsp:Transcript_36175/g.86996  ORF Transcript_36175/g.86996 Transcript_36175/m.86996 type:complete len:230 (-) Transcript_36175:351-1040(-)